MILLVVSLLFGIPGILMWLGGKKTTQVRKVDAGYSGERNVEVQAYSPAKSIGAILTVVAGIFLLFGVLVPSGVAYTRQINDIETITQAQENQKIYTTKADDLTDQFKGYLAVQYPNLEKEIFTNISASNASVLLIRYPELKSSTTILALVDQIKELRSDIYDQQFVVTAQQRKIRVRDRNPWLVSWLLPSK